MSQFPILRTGAVMQYPARMDVSFSTSVIRFMDGSEQRFRLYQAPLHRWIIQLELLDEGELSQLREFFRDQNCQSFAFTDPSDGVVYSSCSIGDDSMMDRLAAVSAASTSLTIVENRR